MVSSEPAIEALDSRLRRLEFLLTGSTDATPPATGHADASIPTQLASLNDRLARIANQHKSIKKLLQACIPPTSAPPDPILLLPRLILCVCRLLTSRRRTTLSAGTIHPARRANDTNPLRPRKTIHNPPCSAALPPSLLGPVVPARHALSV